MATPTDRRNELKERFKQLNDANKDLLDQLVGLFDMDDTCDDEHPTDRTGGNGHANGKYDAPK